MLRSLFLDFRNSSRSSIYLKGLPLDATPALLNVFQKFGVIRTNGIQVRSQKGFCFGFVEFESTCSMQSALEASPIILSGQKVVIEEKRSTARGKWLSTLKKRNETLMNLRDLFIIRGRVGSFGGGRGRNDFNGYGGNRGNNNRGGYANRANNDGGGFPRRGRRGSGGGIDANGATKPVDAPRVKEGNSYLQTTLMRALHRPTVESSGVWWRSYRKINFRTGFWIGNRSGPDTNNGRRRGSKEAREDSG
ncbi:hypothetical protein Bca52824_014288 [Brassica carinata]|uniref:RRM domain-containing protein n=1 Tax=Brassica carinata TaxID=52824 RepID=A0A8X7W2M8_BRACI|nr:hypothetical protein Bca52824_014288 [Brassica carinata]